MDKEVYEQKLKAIHAYLPMLEKNISRIAEGVKKEAPIDVKLRTLHALVTNKNTKLASSTLDNCLGVLIKVFDKKLNPAITKIKSEPTGSPKSPLTVCSEIRKSPIIIPTERVEESSKSNDLYRRRSPSRIDREFKKEKRSPTRFDRDFKTERLDEYTRGSGGYIKKEPKSSRDYDYRRSSSKDYYDSDKDYKSSKDYKKSSKDDHKYYKDEHKISKDEYKSHKDDHKHRKDDRNNRHKRSKSPKGSKSNDVEIIETDEDLKKAKGSVFDRLGPLKVETKTTLVPVEEPPVIVIEETPVIPIDEIEELLNERLEPTPKVVDVMNIPPLSADDIEGLLNESPPNSSHKELDKKELDELKDLQNRIISEIKADKIDLSSILKAKPSASKTEVAVSVPAQPERLALKFNPHPRKKPIETNAPIPLLPIDLPQPVLSSTLPPLTLPSIFPTYLNPQPVPPPFVPPPLAIKETRTTLITDPRLRSEPIMSYKNESRFASAPSLAKFRSNDAYPMPYRDTQPISSFQNEQNVSRGNPIEVIGETFNRNLPSYVSRPEPTSNFNRPSYTNDFNAPSISSLHISNKADSDAHKNKFQPQLNDMVEREKYERSKKNKSTGEGNNIEVPIHKQSASTSPKSKFDNKYRHGDYSGTNDVGGFKIPKKRNEEKNAGNSNEKSEKCDNEKVKDNKSSEKVKNKSRENEMEKDVLKCLDDILGDEDVVLIEEPVVPPIVIDDDEVDSKAGIVKLNQATKPSEGEVTKEWLESKLASLLNPTVLGKENLLLMMSKVIDEKKMADIKKILDGPDVETEEIADDDEEDEDDLPIVSSKTKKVKPLKSDTENESEHENEPDVDTPVKRRGTRSTTAGGKKRTKKRNELQKLNEDIRTMFISEGVLTATGRRMCTVINESHSPEKNNTPAKKATTPLIESDEETTKTSSTTTTTTAAKKVVKKKTPVQTSKKATTPVAEAKSVEKVTPEPVKKVVKKKIQKKATTPLLEEETTVKKVVKKKSSLIKKATTPLPDDEEATNKTSHKKKKTKSPEEASTTKTAAITLNRCQIRLDKIVDPKFFEPPTLVEAEQQPPPSPPQKQKTDLKKSKKKRSIGWSTGIIRKAKKKKKVVEKERELIPKVEVTVKEEDATKNLKAFLPLVEEPSIPSTSIELPERRASISIADKLNEKFNSVDRTEEDLDKVDEETVEIINVPINENDSDTPTEPPEPTESTEPQFTFNSVCKGEMDTKSPLQKKTIPSMAELEGESSLSSDVNITGAYDDDDGDWEDIESDTEHIEMENSLPDDIPKTGKDASNFQTLQRLFDTIQSDKVKQQSNETSPKSILRPVIKQSPATPATPLNVTLPTKSETKVVTPTIQVGRVVSRVQNLGFVREDVDNTYICCIDSCNYITKDSEVLFTHLKNHNNCWEGYCHICEAHVLSDERIPLTTEYRHMMEVHVKLKSPVSDKPVVFQAKGMIKLRRLSGDKLSTSVASSPLKTVGIDIPSLVSKTVPDTLPPLVPTPTSTVRYTLPSGVTVRKTLQPVAIPKSVSILKKLSPAQISFGARKSTTQVTTKPPIVVHPIISHKKTDSGFNIVSVQSVGKDVVQLPKPDDQVMQITSVMSGVSIPVSDSSSNDSIHFSEIFQESSEVLRPWIKSDSLKSEVSTREMLQTEDRFSLYKCMEKLCSMMTNDRDLFLKHIRKHEQDGEDQLGLNQTSMDMDSWLHCSYCEDIADSCSSLVEHIDEEHASSIFQCTYCFYRSSTAYNVITHHFLHHKNKSTLINISNGASMMLKAEMSSMIQYRKENVKPITCEKVGCPQFFILQEYEDHLKTHDEPTFNCQFCSVVITKDLAIKHLACHSIGLFACIFCHYGTNSIQSIRSHMSNDHSSKLLYVCVRFLRNDVDDPDSTSVDSTVLVHLGDTVSKTVFTNYNITTISKPAISQSSSSSSQAAEDTSCCHILSLLELQKAYLDNGGNTEINEGLLKALAPPPRIIRRRNTKKTMPALNTQFEQLVEDLNLSHESPVKQMPERRQSVFLPELPQAKAVPQRRKSVYVPAEAKSLMPKRRKSIYVQSETQDVFVPEKTIAIPVKSVLRLQPKQAEIDEVVKEMVDKTGLDGEQLYCCCFCDGRYIDHRIFQTHMLKYNRIRPEISCVHCDFNTMRVIDLLVHFKVHQKKRFLCFICDEKCSTAEAMISHFTSVHTKNHKLMPINPEKINRDSDIFVVTPFGKTILDIYTYGLHLIEKKRLELCADKKIFQPNEFDDLPRVSIFESEVFCAVCSYHTKVRMNMIQHLKRHFESKPVASVDPVNPVPCLNQEKHFDKMNNLSCSSQETITKLPSFTNAPKFVVDFRRYICGAKGCVYQTVNAQTLKNHLTTLHNKERGYKCPHCSTPMINDMVSADKVIAHLKLHETKLFKCSHCELYHHQRATLERHLTERKHGSGAKVMVVRDEKTVNFKPPAPIDNTPLWIKNQLTNGKKNIRGILVEEEEEEFTLRFSDEDEADEVEPAPTRIAVVKPSQETMKTNPHVSFICFHCIKRCNTIDELKQHWNQMHKLPKTTSNSITYPGRPFLFKIVKIISCFHCKTTGKFIDVKQHSLRCHPNQSFMCVSVANNKQCGQCDFLFNTEKELEEHYEKEHFKNNAISDKDATFFMDQEFLELLLKINNCVKYKCEYCDLIIDDKEEMRTHCTEIHPINQVCIKEASNDIQYACSMCKDIFSEEFEALRHIRSHGPTFKCNYCEKNFKSTKMLKQHHEIIHNKSDSTYRTQDLNDQMENYMNMKVIFPNGLILLKNDLAKTNYGKLDEMMAKIEHWNQQDQQEISDKKTALHLHTTLNRNAPGPASKKRLNNSTIITNSPKRMKPSGSSSSKNKRSRSDSSSGDEYHPDGSSDSGSKSSRKSSKRKTAEYSFYGQKRESADLSQIYTRMNIGGRFVKVSVDRFSAIFDINPLILIPKVKGEK